ncbi:ABC transporter [Candidatus Marinamargulisbacteria bacterium SCGC AG-343-K17]|nr:ABC transporter [Candidatus Marinamargulisbacteria bacterium SCGC AG-343-K17]
MSLVIDYPVIISLIGASLIGITSGIISCYAVLKEQSLLGDAIAHAALPGLCLAFLFTLSKQPVILLIGAIGAGLIGTLLITTIIRKSILKEDTALGIILSVFFGFGTLLLTMIQKIPTARQSGLDSYLFGNAASMLKSDITIMAILTIIIIIITLLFWKEFKCSIFDIGHFQTQGFSPIKIELLMVCLTVITIIIGLQTVGVILMSAMIIAPATAAKLWHQQLGPMMLLSIGFALISGIGGVLLSSSIHHLPTGPTIVTVISAIVAMSLLISPNGLLWQWIRKIMNKRAIRMESILTNLYTLAKTHSDHTHPHDINTLRILGGVPPNTLLKKLENNGLIYHHENHHWGLTETGITKAIQILQRVH